MPLTVSQSQLSVVIPPRNLALYTESATPRSTRKLSCSVKLRADLRVRHQIIARKEYVLQEYYKVLLSNFSVSAGWGATGPVNWDAKIPPSALDPASLTGK